MTKPGVSSRISCAAVNAWKIVRIGVMQTPLCVIVKKPVFAPHAILQNCLISSWLLLKLIQMEMGFYYLERMKKDCFSQIIFLFGWITEKNVKCIIISLHLRWGAAGSHSFIPRLEPFWLVPVIDPIFLDFSAVSLALVEKGMSPTHQAPIRA